VSARYEPGSFFLAPIEGLTGTAIRLGQRLAGASPYAAQWCHAGIITTADGATVEAQPGGAIVGHLADYDGRPLLISDGPVQSALAAKRRTLAHLRRVHPLLAETTAGVLTGAEATLRQRIVAEAEASIGTPYSFLDYASLAAIHLHLPSRWIEHRVATGGHELCSQLVDAVYARSWIALFDDNRFPGDVMPADLAQWAFDWRDRQASMARHPAGRAIVPAPSDYAKWGAR